MEAIPRTLTLSRGRNDSVAVIRIEGRNAGTSVKNSSCGTSCSSLFGEQFQLHNEKRWNEPHSKRFATFDATNLAKPLECAAFRRLKAAKKQHSQRRKSHRIQKSLLQLNRSGAGRGNSRLRMIDVMTSDLRPLTFFLIPCS